MGAEAAEAALEALGAELQGHNHRYRQLLMVVVGLQLCQHFSSINIVRAGSGGVGGAWGVGGASGGRGLIGGRGLGCGRGSGMRRGEWELGGIWGLGWAGPIEWAGLGAWAWAGHRGLSEVVGLWLVGGACGGVVKVGGVRGGVALWMCEVGVASRHGRGLRAPGPGRGMGIGMGAWPGLGGVAWRDVGVA